MFVSVLNGTVAIIVLLEVEVIPLTWVNYCAMPPTDQLVWEERGIELNKEMFYLMKPKNKNVKKNLHLAYSQGNITAYLPKIKGVARYLSTQFPNNKFSHQRNSKRGYKEGGWLKI